MSLPSSAFNPLRFAWRITAELENTKDVTSSWRFEASIDRTQPFVQTRQTALFTSFVRVERDYCDIFSTIGGKFVMSVLRSITLQTQTPEIVRGTFNFRNHLLLKTPPDMGLEPMTLR